MNSNWNTRQSQEPQRRGKTLRSPGPRGRNASVGRQLHQNAVYRLQVSLLPLRARKTTGFPGVGCELNTTVFLTIPCKLQGAARGVMVVPAFAV